MQVPPHRIGAQEREKEGFVTYRELRGHRRDFEGS
jgi:hypothetical protein